MPVKGVVSQSHCDRPKVVLVRQISKQKRRHSDLEAESRNPPPISGQQKSYLMMSGLGIR